MIARLGEKRIFWLTLAIVVAVAVWFRIDGLTKPAFWLDEAYSAYGAEKSFSFIGQILPGYETHPPFYTALLRCWILVFGNSILGFRSLGVVTGLISLIFVWFAAREVGTATGRSPVWTGLAALAMAAVLPAIVVWTGVARPYAPIMLAYGAGLWAVLKIARTLREEGRIPNGPWYLYLLCQALLFWLHNLGALNVASLGLGLIILCGPLRLYQEFKLRFIAGHALLLLAALPAFLILLDQAPTWVNSTWLAFNPSEVPLTLLEVYGVPWYTGAGFAIALIVMAFRNEARVPAALLTMTLFPVMVSLLVSATITPVFLPRTLIAVTLPFVMLLGLGVVSGPRMGVPVYLLLLLLAAKLSFEMKETPRPENWYGAADWLKSRIKPGDLIYAYPNETALPLHYALRERQALAPIRPIPEAVPSHDPTGWYPTGSRGVVSLPQYRLEQIASDAQSQGAQRIWLVRLGAPKYDKGQGLVRALLRSHVPFAIWPNRKLTEEPPQLIDIIGLQKRQKVADRKN